MNNLKPALTLFVLIFVAGCASNYTVVDRTGMTFNLTKVRLEKGDNIEILDGEAVRIVPLSGIAKLVKCSRSVSDLDDPVEGCVLIVGSGRYA